MLTLDARIEALEAKLGLSGVSGVSLSRAQIHPDLFKEFDIKSKSKTIVEGWALAIGVALGPKQYFYGLTIGEAVGQAENKIYHR